MAEVTERAKRFINVDDPIIRTTLSTLDLAPTACIILTAAKHETVWYNKAFADTYLFRLPNPDGDTLPQMLGCLNSIISDSFVYSEYCEDCPLHLAIASTDEGISVPKRGVLTVPAPWGKTDIHAEAYAKYISLDNKDYLLLFIKDIENEATRYQLNRTFFHDLLNIAQQLRSSISLSRMILEDAKRDGYRVPTQINKELDLISSSVAVITDKVNKERQLNNAQNDTLIPHIAECEPQELIRELLSNVSLHDEKGGRLLALVPCPSGIAFTTDRLLALQVCYALLHTLIYSSRAEQIIEIGYRPDAEAHSLTFWFRNRELTLSANKIAQFRTEYSLKRLRNLSSYTIGILAEKYLKGTVNIQSDEETGTVLELTLPLQYSEADTLEEN
ncbi:hypothetical protein IJT17_07355 [bacterium]|nr:hypothetical protein [bacterium]